MVLTEEEMALVKSALEILNEKEKEDLLGLLADLTVHATTLEALEEKFGVA